MFSQLLIQIEFDNVFYNDIWNSHGDLIVFIYLPNHFQKTPKISYYLLKMIYYSKKSGNHWNIFGFNPEYKQSVWFISECPLPIGTRIVFWIATAGTDGVGTV